jgi:hypothetical protein
VIPDVNSGSSCYEAEVPCMGWNFLFYIGLTWILYHVFEHMIFVTRQVPVMSWATILFTCYSARKLSVSCVCWTVAISFCCVVLRAWCWTVSSASTHTSWRTQCLYYVNSFFSLCVCLTQYAICLDYHNHRKWGVTHSVICRSIVYRETLE